MLTATNDRKKPAIITVNRTSYNSRFSTNNRNSSNFPAVEMIADSIAVTEGKNPIVATSNNT